MDKKAWLDEVKAEAARLTQKRYDDYQAELKAGRIRDGLEVAEVKAPVAKKESK